MRDGNIGICWDAGHIGICGICGEDGGYAEICGICGTDHLPEIGPAGLPFFRIPVQTKKGSGSIPLPAFSLSVYIKHHAYTA